MSAAHDLSTFPAITPTQTGRIRVLPRPAVWDNIAVLESPQRQPLGLAATRRTGDVLEIAIRPVTDATGKLDGRKLNNAILDFLDDAIRQHPMPAHLSGQEFATGIELHRSSLGDAGRRGLAWRLTMRALAEVNRG